MNERGNETLIGVGVATVVLVFLTQRLIVGVIGIGVILWLVARRSARRERSSTLDLGAERQAMLERDPLVITAPPGTESAPLGETVAWDRILQGGSDANAWVRRRYRILDASGPEPAHDRDRIAAWYRDESERLGWEVDENDDRQSTRCRRSNGMHHDLVVITVEGGFVSVTATVVD